MAGKSRRSDWRVLLILLIAAGFRIYGIQFGLPELCHADEPIVVNHALAYGAGDFHPHFFKLPPLLSYLLFGCYGLFYWVLKATGRVGGPDDFAAFFLQDPTPFYLLGRAVFGVGLGILTVFAVYRLLQKYFSERHAWLASFFLAVCFLHVRDSHYIYPDIPLGLLLVLCFFPIFNILKEAGKRDYVIFGLLWGASVAMKYNGMFIAIPFFAAHFWGPGGKAKKQDWQHLAVTCGSAAGTFVVLNPFALIDFPFFVKELLGQSHSEGFLGFFHHFGYSLMGGIGFPLLLSASLGILFVVLGRDLKQKVVLSFVAGYYLVLAFFSQPHERYVLPLVPFVLFFAADFLIELANQFQISKWGLVLCAFLVASPPLVKAYVSDRIFSEKDVRLIAREWIESSLPSGAKIALDNAFFMPQLNPTADEIREKMEVAATRHDRTVQEKRMNLLLKQAEGDQGPRYELYFLKGEGEHTPFLFATPNVPYQVQALKKRGIQYVLFCKLRRGYQSVFHEDLTAHARLLRTFNPYKDKARKWPMDDRPLTGGPFLWLELLTRERNGQIVELYQL